MNDAIVPIPRNSVTVRAAVAADLPFIDGLQKLHAKQVGWMPTKQLEGKIRAGHVLIAEERHEGTEARRHEGGIDETALDASLPGPHSVPPCLGASVPVGYSSVPVGYVIGHDQYFKRDDVGIIYQMNVVPDRQRGLIGATLVKAMFERAAYGCRLFCCWCAQDIEANYFWESLGFIPLAFRAGSRDKGRVHIFWQRRIRAGDETTPYWFPSQTTSGSIREDRLVFPIPPGVHWRDEMPRVLPALSAAEGPSLSTAGAEHPKLESRARTARRGQSKLERVKPAVSTLGRLCFAPPVEAKAAKTKRETRPKAKNDPKFIAAARELRDRWLERVNAPGGASVLASSGKYEVSRVLMGPGVELPSGIRGALPARIAA